MLYRMIGKENENYIIMTTVRKNLNKSLTCTHVRIIKHAYALSNTHAQKQAIT